MTAAEFQAHLQTHLDTVHADAYEHSDCATCDEIQNFIALTGRLKGGARMRIIELLRAYKNLVNDATHPDRPTTQQVTELVSDLTAIEYSVEHELHTGEDAERDRTLVSYARTLLAHATPPPAAPPTPVITPATTKPRRIGFLDRFRSSSPPPEAPTDTTPRDVLMCAGCCFERPRAAFSVLLTLPDWLPVLAANGYPPSLRYPEPDPHPWARVRLKARVPDEQRCDACLGYRACFRCHRPLLHRRQGQDAAYIKRVTANAAPENPTTDTCEDCQTKWRVLDDDAVAFLQSLAKSSPPDEIAASKSLTFGTTPQGTPVTITDTDRTRHVYLIGGTGSGKSVTLTNLAAQDISTGHGFTVIDPHGDLAQGLLARVPPQHFDRVTYFDPTDEDAPAFNLLAADFDANKLTADIVATFKMFFGESWGFQMEALLSHALLTLLLDRPHELHSLADVRTLLIDEDYRATIVSRSADELRSFWDHDYKQMTKDAARPILTRLGLALMPGSPLRKVLTNRSNALDVRAIMDGKKILLVNLSKGALGEQPARLLGGLIVTAITQAALARQRLPENQRVPHTLYCDEFQNFADLPSTGDILSEARKYQLRLVLAHQTMAQVNSELMANILGNVKTVVGFNVSPHDAAKLAQRMARTRNAYPDTGDAYDLATERRNVAARFLKRVRWHFGDEFFPEAPPDIPLYHPDHQQTRLNYGRKGFPDTSSPDAALNWLRSVARVDPTSYDPGRSNEFNWKATTWPTPQDFQNLPTCHAFIMRNVAASTCELRVPFPPSVPYPDNLDRWHQKRRVEISKAETAEKNRPPTIAQDERNATKTTSPLHQESTSLPDPLPATSPPLPDDDDPWT